MTRCCWSCIRKSNSPARCCELCQRSLAIRVTKFYQKCIYQGRNNDIRSRSGSSERDRGFSDQSCTSYRSFKYFRWADKLEEFVHVGDENSEEFATTVLEDVEELLEMMKIAEKNLDDDNDDDILTSQASGSGLGNTVVFKGFESLYKQIVDIEDQLFYSEVREKAEETFDDLRKLFESFQSKVQVVTLKAKRKNLQNLRQMTIHDMLN